MCGKLPEGIGGVWREGSWSAGPRRRGSVVAANPGAGEAKMAGGQLSVVRAWTGGCVGVRTGWSCPGFVDT